jgi:hypothetical protein
MMAMMAMANNNTMEALKCGTRAREIILGIGIIERREIIEVRREVRRNEYSKR